VNTDVKRPECEAGHSPPPRAEVKNTWSFTFTIPIRLPGFVFKYGDNFIYQVKMRLLLVRLGAKRNVHRMLVAEPLEKWLIERSRWRWENDIKVVLTEIDVRLGVA
jgi:hypothetical protein